MRVITKTPGEAVGTIESITNDLHTFQSIVGGYIECIQINDDPEVLLICDEEARLKHRAYNMTVMGADILGTIVICGCTEDGDFADVPISLKEWEENYVKKFEGQDI